MDIPQLNMRVRRDVPLRQMKIEVAELVDGGLVRDLYTIHDAAEQILVCLESHRAVSVSNALRPTALEIISGYTAGLRAMAIGIPIN